MPRVALVRNLRDGKEQAQCQVMMNSPELPPVTQADIADLGEQHGHRSVRVCGKGSTVVLIPLPPAVG